ncbi:MAG: hypothetical protein OXD42_08205, partial [Rhodospirillaceae bacterium]|nr:hypothetical protein [Rhodospirillaceae bacterium]
MSQLFNSAFHAGDQANPVHFSLRGAPGRLSSKNQPNGGKRFAMEANDHGFRHQRQPSGKQCLVNRQAADRHAAHVGFPLRPYRHLYMRSF